MKITSNRLTNCGVAADGKSVRLEFVDHSGTDVTVLLPLDQAEAVVMTLPHLLARALKQSTGNDEARYAVRLDEWSIEGAKGQDCLITTLKTTDGFEVSFGIPFEACRTLGQHLQRGADEAAAKAAETGKSAEETIVSSRVKFN